MANTTITALSAAATLTGTEVLPIDQSGSTVKVTTADVAALAPGVTSIGVEAENYLGITGSVLDFLTAANTANGFVILDDSGNLNATLGSTFLGPLTINGDFTIGSNMVIASNGSFVYPTGGLFAASTGLYYLGGALLADSNALYYSNSIFLTDGSSSLYYGSGSILADAGGSLYYGSSDTLATVNGALFYSNGNGALTDLFGGLYSNLPNGSILTSVGTGGATIAASPSDIAALIPAGNFIATGTATTSFMVAIGVTMPDTNYTVSISPGNALSAAIWYISAKTTSTFTVTYLTGLTGAVAFDWLVIEQ